MNSIPLIKGNTPQEINTSIIALKKALSELEAQDRLLQGTDKDVQAKIKQINQLIEEINTHLGTVDSHLSAIDGQITALQPVDTVTSGNMHSVTSNAVANSVTSLRNYVLDSTLFRDFRNDNFLPSYYTDKRIHEEKGVFLEFKDGSVIGITFNVNFFVMLITFVPWADLSGGVPVQLAMRADACWQRYAVDYSTWSNWKLVY